MGREMMGGNWREGGKNGVAWGLIFSESNFLFYVCAVVYLLPLQF
jgi:hypothetical protein